MTNVVNLDDQRAHLTVFDIEKNAHIIPLSLFIAIAKGTRKIEELEDYDKILPTIIVEWLYNIGVDTGQIN
jgi:hypothetical protein